jgi:hypothetical protein
MNSLLYLSKKEQHTLPGNEDGLFRVGKMSGIFRQDLKAAEWLFVRQDDPLQEAR